MKDALTCEKLRQAGKRRNNRRCPNGATRHISVIPKGKRTGRSETSQYPEEKKSTEILQVVANERGRAQNLCMRKPKRLGRRTKEGDSPVGESGCRVMNEYGGTRGILSEYGGTILQG